MKFDLSGKSIVVVVLLMLLVFSGVSCLGEQSRSTGSSPMSVVRNDKMAESSVGSYDGAPSASGGLSGKMEAEEPSVVSGQSGQSGQDIRKIIRTASLTIYVEDFEQGVHKINGVTEQFGGSIAGSQLHRYSGSIQGTLTLWIPASQLSICVDNLKKIGKVTQANVTSEDISGQYYDVRARLENERRKEARLVAMYEKAKEVKDLLAIEEQIASTRGEIESMEARMKLWDRQVSYSTVTISLIQDIQVVREPDDIWKPIRNAVRSIKPTFLESTQGFLGCLGGLLLLAVALIPWLIVIVPVTILWKKVFREKWRSFVQRKKEESQKRRHMKSQSDVSESVPEKVSGSASDSD